MSPARVRSGELGPPGRSVRRRTRRPPRRGRSGGHPAASPRPPSQPRNRRLHHPSARIASPAPRTEFWTEIRCSAENKGSFLILFLPLSAYVPSKGGACGGGCGPRRGGVGGAGGELDSPECVSASSPFLGRFTTWTRLR